MYIFCFGLIRYMNKLYQNIKNFVYNLSISFIAEPPRPLKIITR